MNTKTPTTNDLESQASWSRKEVHKDLSAEQREYLELVFGNQEIFPKKYPGIQAYCHHLEESFLPLRDDAYAAMWDALGLQRPNSAQGCWRLLIAVFKTLDSEKVQPQDVSIDSVLDSLLRDRGGAKVRAPALSQIAVFAIFCWATMILTPNLRPPSHVLACMLAGRPESDASTQHKLDRCKRAIAVTFHGFKAPAWGRDVMKGPPVATDGNEEIYEASLNMRSLQLFGKVRIQWVTTMTAHLEFDPASRRLSLFQFPTLCVLKCLQGEGKGHPVLERFVALQRVDSVHVDRANNELFCSISEAFDPLPAEDAIHRYITLEQEILLSYRLLFAQSGASRKVARRALAALKRDNPSRFDPFLSVLCERKYKTRFLWWSKVDKDLADLPATAWPVSCRDTEEHLQERDVYSAIEDLPRLGQRLLRVQKFNARWRPSRLTDFWRDRRNPHQWYTFWAVLIFGGAANVLAICQLAVAILQVMPAAHSPDEG